jgi:small subunit ribosomal protein S16
MLKIKLFQRGKKKQRTYRIVVAEARSKRDGKFVDNLGWWNPKEEKFSIDKKKVKEWIVKGAQPTEAVRKLLSR